MATFSPSPAPRRRNPASSSSPRSTPSTVDSRRTGGRIQPSRLGTPSRLRDASFDVAGQSMDVDEPARAFVEKSTKTPVVFAKSDDLSAYLYAALPVEVKHNFRNADFYHYPCTGSVDAATGFALVASARTCFVWQYTQALLGTPTCYIFACPSLASKRPPLHALVPSSSTREPGLILLSESGEVRFWDSISSGLSGGQNYATLSLSLEVNEVMSDMRRSDAQTFVLSTSHGQLFRLTLMSSGGRTTPTAHLFVRERQAATGLSRFLPGVLWGGAASSIVDEDVAAISAIALGEVEETGRDVWALTETNLQRWRLLAEGAEQLMSDDRIDEMVGRAIKVALSNSAPKDDYEFGLELLDVATPEADEILVLASFAGIEEADVLARGDHPRRIYVVARVSYANAVAVVAGGVSIVPYQSTASNTAPAHPRLKLIPESPVVAVQFGDAVAFCAIESQYRDRLELKLLQDRILGSGTTGNKGELLFFTSGTMLRAVLDVENIAQFSAETGHADIIKSTMTQSILYAPIYMNPLRFSLPPDVDEDALMQGAESLSRQVLDSDPSLVKPSLDMISQLQNRMELLQHLMAFINENGACGKMTATIRQRLMFDAERMHSGSQLWAAFEEDTRNGKDENDMVLVAAVHEYMTAADDDQHEDLLRAFFRLHLSNFGLLFPHVADIIARAASEAPNRMSDLLLEANRIVITVFASARFWRRDNAEKYQVQPPLTKAWTSRPAILQVLNDLFNTTHELLIKPELPEEIRNEYLIHLTELATLIFASYHERLEYLNSGFSSESEDVRRSLEAELKVLQPSVLEKLCDHSLDEHAFELAERYQDFQSLAGLCTKDGVFPPEQNPHRVRIEQYTEQYKEAFAMLLYDQYLGRGEARALFALDSDAHRMHLDHYFSERETTETAWVHELGMRRYGKVAKMLLNVADDADELAEKHLILSIGKLAKFADGSKTNTDTDIDVYNAHLDSIAIHERLAEEFAMVKADGRGEPSMDALADKVQRVQASALSDRPAFATVFRQAVRGILTGKALNVEDMVDLLTMKNNNDEAGLDDYVLALNLLHGTRGLPPGRFESSLNTVWRRIYIHDDWNTLAVTAGLADSTVMSHFRSSALYTVIRALDSSMREDVFRSWTIAGAVPNIELLGSRWTEADPRTLEALQVDYRTERQLLENYIQGNVFDRVLHLASEDSRQNK